MRLVRILLLNEKAQDEIQMTWKVYKQKFEEYLSRLQKKSETLEDTGKKVLDIFYYIA